MKNLAIQISDELSRKVKIVVAQRGMTLRGYITKLIEADLKKEQKESDT